MPGALGQASSPAGSSGFQPRVGVRLPRHSRSLGQDAPKTGRLEACPTKVPRPQPPNAGGPTLAPGSLTKSKAARTTGGEAEPVRMSYSAPGQDCAQFEKKDLSASPKRRPNIAFCLEGRRVAQRARIGPARQRGETATLPSKNLIPDRVGL